MRVVHPSVYLKRQQRRRKSRLKHLAVVLIALVLGAYGFMAMSVEPVYSHATFAPSITRQAVNINWPETGSAALGYVGSDQVYLEGFNADQQRPSASTIKMLTALSLASKKPLIVHGGEMINFTEADVARQQTILEGDGSIFLVNAGETMTYRQAMEILLVTSANNIADKLAEYVYGSTAEYISQTNLYAQANGLNQTVVDDTSGLSDATMTSAVDLVKMAKLMIDNEDLREIVSMESVSYGGREAQSTNRLLGGEYIGIKTGYTELAGGCLVVAREVTVKNQEFILISVVMGQNRSAIFDISERLTTEFLAGFKETTIFSRGFSVGKYTAPWGDEAQVVSRESLHLVRYEGSNLVSTVELDNITEGKQHQQVGVIDAGGRKVEAELAEDLPQPSLIWRLEHALDYIGQKL